MRTLLIDNHDSYTYNLYQLIACVTGTAPAVLVNDDPRLARLADGGFGAAVISPGPGRPQRDRDIGHLAGFLDRTGLPLLGAGLGHQAIAHAAGADVGPAPVPRYGHLSTVRLCGNPHPGDQHRGDQHWGGRPRGDQQWGVGHRGDALLRGLPAAFTAVRYHALCVREPLPPVLEVTARAEDGVIMALRHRTLPRWGVQFHPESVAAQFGRELMGNFFALAGGPVPRQSVRLARPVRLGQPSLPSQSSPPPPSTPSPRSTSLPGISLPSRPSHPTWSAPPSQPTPPSQSSPSTRFDSLPGISLPSFPSPPPSSSPSPRSPHLARQDAGATWRLTGRALRVPVDSETAFAELFGSSASGFWLDSAMSQRGLARFSFMGDASGPLSETLTYRTGEANVLVADADGIRAEPGTMFDVLERRLAARRLPAGPGTVSGAGSPAGFGLPFDFTGGYVGYFGYEMKAECGAGDAHRATTPDSVWIFADRLIAVDHETGITYVIAVHDDSDAMRSAARGWVAETARRVTALADPSPALLPEDPDGFPGDRHGFPHNPGGPCGGAGPGGLAGWLVRDPDSYRDDIAECLRQLRLGESYQVCLANRLRLPFFGGDLAFYRGLRRASPAPYGAILRAGGVTVFSSSPERFCRIGAAAAALLAGDPPARAANLIAADLLRGDLGRVCEIGSVAVTRQVAVESYATMHQLAATVTGRLLPSVSAVECVRRSFPAASVTGAPKLRAMEIIDRLETEARGVYSGVLGYFGLGGGADLSVVTRAAVRQGDTLTVGAGGMITLGSDPGEACEEMLSRAAAPLRAHRAGPSPAPDSRRAVSRAAGSREAMA